MNTKLLCTVFLLLLAPGLHSQEHDPRLVDPSLNLAENLHLNAQAAGSPPDALVGRLGYSRTPFTASVMRPFTFSMM